jgi:2-polyprenyl-6-hydroxyphenyl methylase/3-demethylubiquinone-9 3-methyltransferase
MYHFPKMIRSLARFLAGRGQGISAYEIVHHKDNGPHWKEYSGRELRDYFRELSPDFDVRKVNYFTPSRNDSIKRRMANSIGSFLPVFRKNIFVEVIVSSKDNGITAVPRWITA